MSKFQIIIKDENGIELKSTQIETDSILAIENKLKELQPKLDPTKFEMHFVGDRSSNVESLGWIDDTLFVKFKSGGLYTYLSVPHTELEEALKAESVGRYVTGVIKNKYQCKRVS